MLLHDHLNLISGESKMTKLDKLILELCQNGIEYKKLGDIATISRGGSFQKKDYVEKGVRKVICTDISCDGMLQGPSIALYKEILEHHPELYLIASGGVSCADDIRHLEVVGIPAVIFGKALYEGRITFKELENFVS